MPLDKRVLARKICNDLLLDTRVKAILLIGSVARGIESADSDVDLAVFTESFDGDWITTKVVSGTRVGIERFRVDAFAAETTRRFHDLQTLRDFGRFTTGEILYSRWPELSSVREEWARALLHPKDASELFAVAAVYLDDARVASCKESLDLIWMLQGATAALASLMLCLCPARFQKPKWVVCDLREGAQEDILELIRLFFIGQDADRWTAQTVLDKTEKELLAALKWAGLPPLVLTENMHSKYFYVYRTFKDAVSLEQDGDFEGCIYTALYSLRLLNALLQDNSLFRPSLSLAEITQWRQRAIEAVCPATDLPLHCIQDGIVKLRFLELDLKERYRQGYMVTVQAPDSFGFQDDFGSKS